MPRLRFASVTLLLASSTAGCHVFESLESCAADTQCDLGERCNPDGHFCETDTGPIVIGATFALTGAFAHPELQEGLDLAKAIVNGSGGVLGRKITFEVLDDESDVALAQRHVTRL